MADLTVQLFKNVGIEPVFVPASVGGDKFQNTGLVYLIVKNGGVAPIDVTIDSVKACDQGFDHNVVVTVANGVSEKIGPLAFSRFNDEANKVSVAYSGVTSVTVAALKL